MLLLVLLEVLTVDLPLFPDIVRIFLSSFDLEQIWHFSVPSRVDLQLDIPENMLGIDALIPCLPGFLPQHLQ